MVNGLQKIKSVVVKGEAGAADLPRVTSNGGLALAQALAQLEGPAARPVAAPPALRPRPRQRRLLRHRRPGLQPLGRRAPPRAARRVGHDEPLAPAPRLLPTRRLRHAPRPPSPHALPRRARMAHAQTPRIHGAPGPTLNPAPAARATHPPQTQRHTRKDSPAALRPAPAKPTALRDGANTSGRKAGDHPPLASARIRQAWRRGDGSRSPKDRQDFT